VSLYIILHQEQFLKHVHNTFGFGCVHVCTKKLYIEKLSICCCDQSMDYQQNLKSNKIAIFFLQQTPFLKKKTIFTLLNFCDFFLDL